MKNDRILKYRRTDAPTALQGGLWETDNGQLTFTDGQGNKYWFADTTGGNVSIALPAAGDVTPDTIFTVKRTTGGVNTLTITPDSGTIDGAADDTLVTQYSVASYVSDGTNYWTI